MTWDQALEWWPHALLQATWLPRGDAEEALHAFSWKGGRQGDPRETGSSLTLLYQYPPATAQIHDLDGILDGGGLSIGVRFVTSDAPPSSFPPGYSEPVMVRGEAGQHVEFREPEAQDDLRIVVWTQRVDGGTGEWRISSHPDLYGERDVMDFAERMQERV